jgi:cysteine desulfurase
MIYFDNAANHKADDKIIEIFTRYLAEFGGNAESRHTYSNKFRQLLKDKENQLFAKIDLNSYEGLYFNSGTEIFNFIRFFITQNNQKSNIVTSKLEHPAVLANLQQSNTEIRYAKVNEFNQFDIESITNLVDDKTFMVILNFVQSETGLIQKLDTIITRVKKINPKTLILIDAIQGFTKHPIPQNADFYAVSNHKICGNSGGMLIYRKYMSLKLNEFQNAFRHQYYQQGRIEIPQLLTMFDYATKVFESQELNLKKVQIINNFIRTKIKCEFPQIAYCKFQETETTPYILQIIFPNYDGAVLAGLLAEKNIMVSSGSACMAEAKTPSVALKELNFNQQEIFSTLRLSFSPNNTLDEATTFIEILKNIIQNY